MVTTPLTTASERAWQRWGEAGDVSPGIVVTSGGHPWEFGELVELVPVGEINVPFDLHLVFVDKISQPTLYELILTWGEHDMECARLRINAGISTSPWIARLNTRLIRPGSRVMAKLASRSRGKTTCEVSVAVHAYGGSGGREGRSVSDLRVVTNTTGVNVDVRVSERCVMGEVAPFDLKLERFRKNPMVLLNHDFEALPIGRSLWERVRNGALVFKAQLHRDTETARQAWFLIEHDVGEWQIGAIDDRLVEASFVIPERQRAIATKALYDARIVPSPGMHKALGEPTVITEGENERPDVISVADPGPAKATMLDVARARYRLSKWIELSTYRAHTEFAEQRDRWARARARLESHLAAVPANAAKCLHNLETASWADAVQDAAAFRERYQVAEAALDAEHRRADELARALKETQLSYVAEHERAERLQKALVEINRNCRMRIAREALEDGGP